MGGGGGGDFFNGGVKKSRKRCRGPFEDCQTKDAPTSSRNTVSKEGDCKRKGGGVGGRKGGGEHRGGVWGWGNKTIIVIK